MSHIITGGDGESQRLFPDIQGVLDKVLTRVGLETHPFMIAWYNELVGPHFVLPYPGNTLAFVVISGPDVFERCVLPYLRAAFQANPSMRTNNPLDDAIIHLSKLVIEELTYLNYEVDVFHDFDLHPSRKPKVLVQTAAHVAGAAEYFHKSKLPLKVQREVFSEESKLAGVAVHPVYGGWFAIRSVIILKNLQLDDLNGMVLPRPTPLNLIPEEENIIKLIKEFAYNWEENKWRKIYRGIGQEYSQDYQDFLATPGERRWEFLKDRGLLDSIPEISRAVSQG